MPLTFYMGRALFLSGGKRLRASVSRGSDSPTDGHSLPLRFESSKNPIKTKNHRKGGSLFWDVCPI